MSDPVTLVPDSPIETAPGDAPAAASSPPAVDVADVPASTLPLALPVALPPEVHALLEFIGEGLAPNADPATRAAARELWTRFAQMIAAAAPMPVTAVAAVTPATPTLPVTPTPPVLPAMPVLSAIPAVPISPVAMATRALRQLPPDQLLELALQRLRAALPAGATVPMPKGIQFQLVPVTSPPRTR
jgi:hypothetical protein